MKKIMIFFLIFVWSYAKAEKYSDFPLNSFLSQKEQKEIGLAKLDDNEKERLRILILDNFFAGYEKGKDDAMKQTQNHVNSSAKVIESQIDGEFSGFEGETIIKLMNGQIWQQSEYYYYYHYSYMPSVLIYQSGTIFKMKVDGIDKAISVIRLK